MNTSTLARSSTRSEVAVSAAPARPRWEECLVPSAFARPSFLLPPMPFPPMILSFFAKPLFSSKQSMQSSYQLLWFTCAALFPYPATAVPSLPSTIASTGLPLVLIFAPLDSSGHPDRTAWHPNPPLWRTCPPPLINSSSPAPWRCSQSARTYAPPQVKIFFKAKEPLSLERLQTAAAKGGARWSEVVGIRHALDGVRFGNIAEQIHGEVSQIVLTVRGLSSLRCAAVVKQSLEVS